MNKMAASKDKFLSDIRYMGKRIFEEEQQGKDCADYGAYLIKNLAKQLEPEYGSGFSIRQLERSRQFYRLYPIATALRTQLSKCVTLPTRYAFLPIQPFFKERCGMYSFGVSKSTGLICYISRHKGSSCQFCGIPIAL